VSDFKYTDKLLRIKIEQYLASMAHLPFLKNNSIRVVNLGTSNIPVKDYNVPVLQHV
jgi:hypothetical protein